MSSETTGSVGFYEFLAWLEGNKKRLATTAVIAVVVGFAISAYRWKSHQAELAASDALLELRTPLGSTEKTSPPDAKTYLKIAADFPGTDAAERASYLAAGAHFTQGDYAGAHAQFSHCLERHAQHSLAAGAAYGKAASLEAQNKLDEALASYQSLLTQYPNSSVLDNAKLAMARLFELKNQPEQALKSYDELVRPNTPGSASTEALKRKDLLLTKFPALAKTNAPAALATTTTPAGVPATGSATNAPAPKP